MSEKKKTIKSERIPIDKVVGNVYRQTINGTVFNQLVLGYDNSLLGNRYFMVKNTETGFICMMSESILEIIEQ